MMKSSLETSRWLKQIWHGNKERYMKTIYLYEAFDGKRFEDENECMSYEAVNFHPDLFKITFVDENNNICTIDKNDVFNDRIYQNCEEVYIPDEKSLKDILWLAEECGWCEFEDFLRPGHWKRQSDNDYSWNATWVFIN